VEFIEQSTITYEGLALTTYDNDTVLGQNLTEPDYFEVGIGAGESELFLETDFMILKKGSSVEFNNRTTVFYLLNTKFDQLVELEAGVQETAHVEVDSGTVFIHKGRTRVTFREQASVMFMEQSSVTFLEATTVTRIAQELPKDSFPNGTNSKIFQRNEIASVKAGENLIFGENASFGPLDDNLTIRFEQYASALQLPSQRNFKMSAGETFDISKGNFIKFQQKAMVNIRKSAVIIFLQPSVVTKVQITKLKNGTMARVRHGSTIINRGLLSINFRRRCKCYTQSGVASVQRLTFFAQGEVVEFQDRGMLNVLEDCIVTYKKVDRLLIAGQDSVKQEEQTYDAGSVVSFGAETSIQSAFDLKIKYNTSTEVELSAPVDRRRILEAGDWPGERALALTGQRALAPTGQNPGDEVYYGSNTIVRYLVPSSLTFMTPTPSLSVIQKKRYLENVQFTPGEIKSYKRWTKFTC
jgi:hypothetical protein